MTNPLPGLLTRLQDRIAPILTGPPILAFLPAITLAAFWFGGELALLLVSLGFPLLIASTGAFIGPRSGRARVPRDSVTGLMLRDGFDATLEHVYKAAATPGLRSACFVLELDDHGKTVDRHGQAAADLLLQRSGTRLLSTLREGDTVARMGDSRFAVCLMPVRQLDLELCIQISGRLQSALEEPVSVDGLSVYLSCSIGFCLRSRAPGDTAQEWLTAASDALAEAKQISSSSIRAYSAETRKKSNLRSELRDAAASALENGRIQPWFQPQISTDTGRVTGFEALARWTHQTHGLIAPDTFLPILEEAGLMQRLGQVMLYQSLTALKAWDKAGLQVPCVAVNFATDELRNPRLVDSIRWELDRFDLAPERLSVEILETVVSDCPDDTVTRNIAGLASLGCRIDLDDFGTGQASIAAIRRFAVSRIKIDRSFVTKADRDPDQQRLVGAILSMAERLDMETLAEGVETVGEHALLAQLGCDHVQGFGIARPMPFEQTLEWAASHTAKLREAPRIGRDIG
ncbi:putative bifunctional diguanylate cyclase/phosphodiesterase [Sedimentitalea sp. XS_ASV28]|uniref:putative bifunctional diguanylate cyclase/phosphodiesterase n=1 Tax=Sedimentitalea sp. XS_ASV28 TaxID=3241296 RepID=UPI003518093D